MNLHTAELVKALHAVNQHVPSVAAALLAGSLPVSKQHEFAGLLTELGELLHSHADDQETGVIPGKADTAPATTPERRDRALDDGTTAPRP
jgi:hypothetical protein